MSYDKTWHRTYAAEAIKRFEGNTLMAGRADLEFAKYAMTCGQGAKLAKAIGEEAGDSKTVSIAETVIDTISSGNRYRKVTTAQQHALAVAVLEKLGTARAKRDQSMSQNLPTHPLQGLLVKAQSALPATTGRVATQQARIDRRQGAKIILADISASMGSSAWGDQRKIDVLRDAVAYARQQRPARLFAFSGAAREVATIPEPENNTNLAGALEHVLPLDPGTVLVISDGQPDNAERALAAASRFRGAIDVLYVGPESDHAAIAFMRRLAAAAGGGDVQMHDIGKGATALQLQTRISGLLR